MIAALATEETGGQQEAADLEAAEASHRPTGTQAK
jgi:hypothetical protein